MSLNISDFVVYDIEVACNRVVIGIRDAEGNVSMIETTGSLAEDEKDHFRSLCEGKFVVGYNNLGFDTFLVDYLLNRDATAGETHELAQEIISSREPAWQVARNLNAQRSGLNEIDLLHFVLKTKLKVYETRLGMERVETLPFDPSAPITDEMLPNVMEYLAHDLEATWLLLERMFEEIDIRQGLIELTGVEGLLQKTPAGAAEAVVVASYCGEDGTMEPGDIKSAAAGFRDCTYTLQIRDWVKFVCEGTQAGDLIRTIEGTTFEFEGGRRGDPQPPMPESIIINGVEYAFGVGGLHSVDSAGNAQTDEEGTLWDYDVSSYYPSLMLRPGGSPIQLDEASFQNIFGALVKKRLAAKAEGRIREAAALKLVLNSCFGKMGYGYSPLFSPPSFLATTLGGQLALMALAERLGEDGRTVVLSANTDGLLLKVGFGDEARVGEVIAAWEKATGFTMEGNRLEKYRRQNVNTYLAIDAKGKIKSKGGLNFTAGLTTNPDELIIARAVAAWMKDGTPVADTVTAAAEAKDLFSFATVLTTNGPGFRFGDQDFGNVVRAYRSAESGLPKIITRAVGNTGERGKAPGYRIFSRLSHWPDDLDLAYYVSAAEEIIAETSVPIDSRRNTVARDLEAIGFETRGIGGAPGVKTGDNFSGSEQVGVVVAPRHKLIAVPGGVLGDGALRLSVLGCDTVVVEIHDTTQMPPKDIKAAKKIVGVMTNGVVAVEGRGLRFVVNSEYQARAEDVDPEVVELAKAPVAVGARSARDSEAQVIDSSVHLGSIGNDEVLRVLFGDDADEAYVISTTVPPDTEHKRAKLAMWAGGPARLAKGLHLEKDANNYCSISTVWPDSEGVYRRTTDAFKRLHLVMLDDVGTKAGEPSKVGFGVPTARIETSPGNFQHLYKLTVPLENRGAAEALVEGITRHGAVITDKGAGGINRVFRLPVGINNKLKYGPTPFQVRLVEWNPSASYTAEDIAGWVGAGDLNMREARKLTRAAPADRIMEHPIVGAFSKLGKLVAGKPRHNGWLGVECPWCNEHTGRADDGAAIRVTERGTWSFRCHHGHCSEEHMVMIGGKEVMVPVRGARAVARWMLTEHNIYVPEGREAIWGSTAMRDARDDDRARRAEQVNDDDDLGQGVDGDDHHIADGADVTGQGGEEQGRGGMIVDGSFFDQGDEGVVAEAYGLERDDVVIEDVEVDVEVDGDDLAGDDDEQAGGDDPIWPRAETLSVFEMIPRFVFITSRKQILDMSSAARMMSLDEFNAAYVASKTELEVNGETKLLPSTKKWFESDARISCDSVTYAPGCGKITDDPAGRVSFNIWTKVPLPDISDWKDRVGPFLNHVKLLFGESTDKFLDWCAHNEQHPEVLPHAHWLHVSPNNHGTGRNWIAGSLARVWIGESRVDFDLERMFRSNFNEELSHRRFVVVSEMVNGSSESVSMDVLKARAQVMKRVMTAESHTIEHKYGPKTEEWNRIRWMVFSNSINAIPIEPADRRWHVAKFEGSAENEEYFRHLYSLQKDPQFIGSIRLLLAKRNIGRFNPGERPQMNEAKQEVITAAQSPKLRTLTSLVKVWPAPIIPQEWVLRILASDANGGKRVWVAMNHGEKGVFKRGFEHFIREADIREVMNWASKGAEKGKSEGRNRFRIPEVKNGNDRDKVYSLRDHTNWKGSESATVRAGCFEGFTERQRTTLMEQGPEGIFEELLTGD
jgi:hypothetical protein